MGSELELQDFVRRIVPILKGWGFLNSDSAPVPRAAPLGFVAGALTVANDVGVNYIVDAAVTITGVSLYAQTAPLTSAAEFDVKYSTNNGSSFATIFSTKPTIAASSHVGGSNAVLSVTTLNAGDCLRLDCTATGGTAAQNVTAILKLTTR